MSKAVFRAAVLPNIGPVYMPMDDDGCDMVRAMLGKKKGVMLEGHAPRNPQHHRLLFALIRLVIDNADEDLTSAGLLTKIKFAVGHVDEIEDDKGNRLLIPASISYVSMSQDKFNVFFNTALDYVCSDFLHGADKDDVRNEVYAILDQGHSDLRAAR